MYDLCMQWCHSCKKFADLKVYPGGSFDCPTCGRVEVPRHMHCARCGFACPHVECAGIHCCPNCGDPKPVGSHYVTYEFGQGCDICGLEGHPPKSGYMESEPCGSPRVGLGLAPGFHEEDVKEIMEE